MQTVAVLAYDQAPTFEIAIPYAVFGAAALAQHCRVVTVAGEPGLLRTEHGLTLAAEPSMPPLGTGDLMVVAGWRDGHEHPPHQLVDRVQEAAAAGATIASLCTGAFVLAAAGLLDGRTVTTHWAWADLLAERYPRLRIDPHVLYVDGGDVLTSAGTAAGLDLSLHIVRTRHGTRLANAVARHLVLPAHREGGQAQYLPSPVTAPGEPGPLQETMDWMRTHLDTTVSIAELARRSHLSPRQYVRRFRTATGTSPYQWLLDQRLTAARELLEGTDATVEDIARRCGFGDATALRSHFRRRLATTPTQYRRTFGWSEPLTTSDRP
ncbi:GlxA family transcriptional regulator [Pseudonocardia sp. CA-107938]|uniref:GlxA family transcriptional regulator n=1 Tax=Pseudonocardia sp. CA-107938 TaxID=3240021 RepID=UPI003D90568A